MKCPRCLSKPWAHVARSGVNHGWWEKQVLTLKESFWSLQPMLQSRCGRVAGLHGTHGVLHGIEVAISRLDNLLFMLHHLRRAIWIWKGLEWSWCHWCIVLTQQISEDLAATTIPLLWISYINYYHINVLCIMIFVSICVFSFSSPNNAKGHMVSSSPTPCHFKQLPNCGLVLEQCKTAVVPHDSWRDVLGWRVRRWLSCWSDSDFDWILDGHGIPLGILFALSFIYSISYTSISLISDHFHSYTSIS